MADTALRMDVAAPEPMVSAAERDRAAVEVWILARCMDSADVDLAGTVAGSARRRAGRLDGTEQVNEPDVDGGEERNARARKNHTALAYRREATRFMLWLSEVRGRDLAGARLEDVVLYRAFLADPQPRGRWCGPKGAPVGSPAWRPFEGPLSPRSRRQALVVLKSMFHFLQDQGYVTRNPVTGVAMPRNSSPSINPGRSLSAAQLALVLRAAAARAATPSRDQLAWAVRFLQNSGLRLSEFTGARVENLRFVEVDDGASAANAHDDEAAAKCVTVAGQVVVRGGWVIGVLGKGSKPREVAVAAGLVEELRGLVAQRRSQVETRVGTPLVVSWRRDGTGRWQGQGALSAQAFHRQLKRLMEEAADLARDLGRDGDAQAIERCSTHWLRHSHGRAAIAAGVELDVVAASLGHASLATTTIYTRPGLGRRIEQAGRLKLIE